MSIKEMAELYYEKQQMAQEMGECDPDTGDAIYCRIGELLQQVTDRDLADQIDILILKMSDADKREYYIRGFEEGVNSANAIKI